MPTGNAVDFQYYKYVDDAGDDWSVKVDKLWGDNADSGFAAFDAADPVLVPSPAQRPRMIFLQDPVTGRKTSRIVGTTAATAWTTAGYASTQVFRGLAGTVAVTKYGQRGEHIRRARAIINPAEPSNV